MGGPWLDHEKGKLTAFHHSVLEGQASTLCFPCNQGFSVRLPDSFFDEGFEPRP